jgi:hypothetical protein
MGTSKGYQMPTGGNWTPLKNDATDFVQGTANENVNPENLVKDFVRATGGFKGLMRGHGGNAPSVGGGGSGAGAKKGGGKAAGAGGSGGGSGAGAKKGGGKAAGGGGSGGGSGPKTSAAVGTARNFGGFLSNVNAVGLAQALRDRGLDSVVGKSAAYVADALLDEFAGPASTLDNALARESLAEVRDEILTDAESFEEVEERLNAAIDEFGIFGILVSFFGHYIFKMFCRNFYEEWVKKVGDAKAGSGLGQIKEYITSSLRTKLAGKKVTTVDWKQSEGKQFVESVLRETVEVFGVTA